jgi:hypothetical protein
MRVLGVCMPASVDEEGCKEMEIEQEARKKE